MVLADSTGALVAGAGAWPICQELAAFAPLLAQQVAFGESDSARTMETMRRDVTLRTMLLDGAEVILAARGPLGRSTDAMLVRAAAGCRRILGVAD